MNAHRLYVRLVLEEAGYWGAWFWEHRIHPSGFRSPEGHSCQESLTFKGEEAVFCEHYASLSKVLKTWSKCKLYIRTWRRGAPGNLHNCRCELLHHPRFGYRGWNSLLSQEHSWCWHPFRSILFTEEEQRSSLLVQAVVEYVGIREKNYQDRFKLIWSHRRETRRHFSDVVN